MERLTISDPREDAGGALAAQRRSLKSLIAGFVGQNLAASSLSSNSGDAAFLLACVDMLGCRSSARSDSFAHLAMLTDLVSRRVGHPVTQNSPKNVTPLSPSVSASTSIPSPFSSGTSVSAWPFLFRSPNDESQDAPRAKFHETESLVRDTHRVQEKEKNYVDAVEENSTAILPKRTAAVARRVLRSSDSSTSTAASHSCSSSPCSNICADGQQQSLRRWVTSTSLGKTWDLKGPSEDGICAGDGMQADALKSKIKCRWTCGQRDIARAPILSTPTYLDEGNMGEESHERGRQPDFADLTESGDLPPLSDDCRQTSPTGEDASAPWLYEATSPYVNRDQQQQRQQQHLPTRRIGPEASARVDRPFSRDSLAFDGASSPSCTTDRSRHDICAKTNGYSTGDPEVSGFRTTALRPDNVVAGTLHPSSWHETPLPPHGKLLKQIDEPHFSGASAGILKTIEQIRRLYAREKFRVNWDALKGVQGTFAQMENRKELHQRRPILPNPYMLDAPSSTENGEAPLLKEITGENRRNTGTIDCRSQRPNGVAVDVPNSAQLPSADCSGHGVSTDLFDGIMKVEEGDKVRNDGQSKVQGIVEGFNGRTLRSQYKDTIETYPKKVQRRDDQDYLQMAKKLPKFAGVIFDRLHTRWVSTYHDKETRKVMRKYFAVRKHGFEHAYWMAVKHRKMKMLERQNDCESGIVMQHEPSNFCEEDCGSIARQITEDFTLPHCRSVTEAYRHAIDCPMDSADIAPIIGEKGLDAFHAEERLPSTSATTPQVESFSSLTTESYTPPYFSDTPSSSSPISTSMLCSSSCTTRTILLSVTETSSSSSCTETPPCFRLKSVNSSSQAF